MIEQKFWSALEFRLSRELDGYAMKGLGRLWCDGIAPIAYLGSDSPPRIEGEAWIGVEETSLWKFTLLLPRTVATIEEINWAELLPAEELTHWVAVDTKRQRLQLEPASARAWHDVKSDPS